MRRNSFHMAASLKLRFVTRWAAITPFTEIVDRHSKTSAIKTIIASSIPYEIHVLFTWEKTCQAISTVIVNVASLHTDSFTVSHFEVIRVNNVMVPADTA